MQLLRGKFPTDSVLDGKLDALERLTICKPTIDHLHPTEATMWRGRGIGFVRRMDRCRPLQP